MGYSWIAGVKRRSQAVALMSHINIWGDKSGEYLICSIITIFGRRLGIKLARLKMLTGTWGRWTSKYWGRASPLKDTERDESSETAELRTFFVAILQRPIRCQREYLSCVSTRGTPQRSAAQSSPDLSVSFSAC